MPEVKQREPVIAMQLKGKHTMRLAAWKIQASAQRKEEPEQCLEMVQVTAHL